MVQVNFTDTRGRYLVDHEYTMFGLFPSGRAEMEKKDMEGRAEVYSG